MRTIQKILFICTLVTAAFLVSGCTETLSDEEPESISLNDIADIDWHWSALIETEPASQSVVPYPENYIITFAEDGTYSIKADCNRGSGNFILDGNELTLNPGPITLAYCGPESLDTQYLALLSNVTSISLDNDQLVLNLGENGDRMIFVKQSDETEPLLSFNGTISSFEEGDPYPMILLESEEINSSGFTQGIKFVISEDTVVVDPNGGLFDAKDLREGMELMVFAGPAMTRSIPPIGQAKVIRMV